MTPHNPNTCKTCGPYINTAAYARGVAKAKQMAAQRDKDIENQRDKDI